MGRVGGAEVSECFAEEKQEKQRTYLIRHSVFNRPKFSHILRVLLCQLETLNSTRQSLYKNILQFGMITRGERVGSNSSLICYVFVVSGCGG